jgi:hypothetical protein
MALPLNVFKSVTHTVTASGDDIYTAPITPFPGYTGIILMIQLCNISSTSITATLSIKRNTTSTELIKDFTIPAKDSLSPISGKLILEPGMSLSVSASRSNDLKLIMSVVESAND